MANLWLNVYYFKGYWRSLFGARAQSPGHTQSAKLFHLNQTLTNFNLITEVPSVPHHYPNYRKEEIQVNTLHINTLRKLASVAIAFSVFAIGGCSSIPLPPTSAEEGLPPPMHDYLVGPGDSVNITVWRNPEVSTSVPVRPDGKITTPLVEDLPASGKTSSQLARDIEKALAKYIQDPVVTVIVTGFVGPYSEQIRVIGQAAKPQALPYREGMSLMDVMIAVGGITEFASGNKASIIRGTGENRQKLAVRLDDLIKEGDISANTPMRPGDILVIPESFF